MKLKVIGTGSKGNCYVLENDNEALIIECGVNIKEIKQALNFNLAKVSGCIISHEHSDHAKSIKEVMKAGVDVYASQGTLTALSIDTQHRANVIRSKQKLTINRFTILPFDVNHDAAEPMGFIINHPDTGNVLFLTDTFYSAYTFKNLNNIIIEANYSKAIIDRRFGPDSKMEFLRNRILKSHMSLENCLITLSKNNLSQVNNIVLIHLSDGNSNEVEFKKAVESATQKHVSVASNGMKINFNKTPF